ncbi:MAG: hypothetical protein LBF16_06700 [Pseudomonadales bacterium]|jgi:hypothetical protein|nr:hypothetical protein [Pseudomonadales bacterium]
MKRNLVVTAIAVIALLFSSSRAPAADQLSDQQLYNNGAAGYTNGNCVTVARYWYAYLLRNPAGLTANRRAWISSVIDSCEQAPTRYASTFTTFYRVPPTRQAACDTYGELAVEQYEAAQANNCGFSGPQWHSNKDYHSQWCMTVQPIEDSKERSARNVALTQCLAQPPTVLPPGTKE